MSVIVPEEPDGQVKDSVEIIPPMIFREWLRNTSPTDLYNQLHTIKFIKLHLSESDVSERCFYCSKCFWEYFSNQRIVGIYVRNRRRLLQIRTSSASLEYPCSSISPSFFQRRNTAKTPMSEKLLQT